MIIYIIYHNPYLSIIYKQEDPAEIWRQVLSYISWSSASHHDLGRCRSLEVKDFSNEGGWVYQLDGEKFYPLVI